MNYKQHSGFLGDADGGGGDSPVLLVRNAPTEHASLLFPTMRSPQNCASYCLCLGELISMQSGQMDILYTEGNGIYEHFSPIPADSSGLTTLMLAFAFLPFYCRLLSNCMERMFFPR